MSGHERRRVFFWESVVVYLLAGLFMGLNSCDAPGARSQSQVDRGGGRDVSLVIEMGDAQRTPSADAALGDDDFMVDLCPAPPSCTDRQRLVGCTCVHVNDRRCLRDEDCRHGESCTQATLGVLYCHYEAPPLRRCPGVGCEARLENSVLLGATREKVITPLGFEVLTEAGFDGEELSAWPLTDPSHWRDCGLDGLCPEDPLYRGSDEGEGDGQLQGMWLAGFAHGRPAAYCPAELIGCAGVNCCVSRFAHDELTVQVVLLRQSGVTVAFAVVDTVGMFHSDLDRIAERVKSLGVDLLVMAATHNHEAPDTSGQWGAGVALPQETGRNPRFLARIEAQTVAAVQESLASLVPVYLRAGVIDVGTEGLAISDSRAPYIFNDDLPIVQLVAVAGGDAIATMLSFGNHVEVLWARNRLITSDYPHFVRRHIRDGLAPVRDERTGEQRPALAGTGGVVAFFAGSVGGLITPSQGEILDNAGRPPAERHSFAGADAIGRRIANHVLSALSDGRVSAIDLRDQRLRFATKRYLVPVENQQMRLAAQLLDLIRRDVYNIAMVRGMSVPGLPYILSEVAAVAVGPITFFTAPGEVFSESLCGGFPGRSSTHSPVIGDVAEHRVPAQCGEDGLPEVNGEHPCVIRGDAENPPDWASAPHPPYVYEQRDAGQITNHIYTRYVRRPVISHLG